MALLYAVVARGATVLADHSSGDGAKYGQAARTILSKIPPNSSRLTYAADGTLFHYIKEGQTDVISLVVADDSLGRRLPFAFLTALYKEFLANFSIEEIAEAPDGGCASFNDGIGRLMDQFMTAPTADPVKQAQAEIASVKDIMVHNVGMGNCREAILSRGERIELLVDKTDSLSSQARAFRKRSVQLRRKMWYKSQVDFNGQSNVVAHPSPQAQNVGPIGVCDSAVDLSDCGGRLRTRFTL